MKKILLTGATGFIGQYFLNYLLKKNLSVRVLIRHQKDSSFLPEAVEIFIGDLTDATSLNGICNDIDTIFHLAGFAHAWADNNISFSQKHYLVNFQGTQNLLNEAIKTNVAKFIYFSSVKAVADHIACIDESWERAPKTPYGLAKRQAEQLVLDTKQYNMHVSVIRPSLVYGPGWKGNLANMMRAIDRGIFPPLPETENRRSMISIEDICQAAFLAANNPIANGKIYFVTDQENYSTRQIYNSMRLALGKSIPKWHIPLTFFKTMAAIGDKCKKLTGVRFPFNSDTFSKLFGSAEYDSSRIKNDLGFIPTYNFEKMLPIIVENYRNAKC